MCRRVTCTTCGKPTWAGCGQHIEEALAGVAASDRCPGHDAEGSGPAPEPARGFLSRLLRR